MKPTKIVASRKQSASARCVRILAHGMACWSPMQLVVTRNPIGALPYNELIVIRCAAGHIQDSQGVLQEEKA